jgi:hypothetical protein
MKALEEKSAAYTPSAVRLSDAAAAGGRRLRAGRDTGKKPIITPEESST